MCLSGSLESPLENSKSLNPQNSTCVLLPLIWYSNSVSFSFNIRRPARAIQRLPGQSGVRRWDRRVPLLFIDCGHWTHRQHRNTLTLHIVHSSSSALRKQEINHHHPSFERLTKDGSILNVGKAGQYCGVGISSLSSTASQLLYSNMFTSMLKCVDFVSSTCRQSLCLTLSVSPSVSPSLYFLPLFFLCVNLNFLVILVGSLSLILLSTGPVWPEGWMPSVIHLSEAAAGPSSKWQLAFSNLIIKSTRI